MAGTIVWQGGAGEVEDIVTVLVPTPSSAGQKFLIGRGRKLVTYTSVTGDSSTTVAAGLVTAWNASTFPEFRNITASSAANIVTLTSSKGVAVQVTTGTSSNEIQTITLNNSPTGGTFAITFDGQTSGTIAYNASAATVTTALEALSNIPAGDITVTGDAGGPWTVEFIDSFAGSDVALMTGDAALLTGGTVAIVITETQKGAAGVDEVQTITAINSPSAGTFTLTFDGQTTGTIAYNASAATVDTALEALSNIDAGDVTCAGGPLPGTPVTVTFTSGLASTDQSLLVGATSLTAPIAAIAETQTGAVGSGSSTINPVAWWKMNESSGNRVDSVGTLDFTQSGGVGSGTGKLGNAGDFDGTNDYLQVASAAAIEFGDVDFSVGFWFKVERGTMPTTGDDAIYLVVKNGSFQFYLFEEQISFVIETDMSGYGISWSSTLTDNTWYFVLAKFVASTRTIAISIDGQAFQTDTANGDHTDLTDDPLTLGGWDTGAGVFNHFTGLIDEMGIWNSALTDANAVTLYNSGLGVTYTPGVNEIQQITVTGGTPTAGTFELTYSGSSVDVPYNVTAGDLDTSLEGLGGIGSGNVSVSGGPLPGTAIDIEFVNGRGEQAIALMTIDNTKMHLTINETTPGSAGLNEQQTVTLTNTPLRGTFTLTFGGDTTSALTYDESAADIELALEALASIGSGNSTVTGVAGGPWVVEFNESKAEADQAMMTSTSSLSNATATVVTTETPMTTATTQTGTGPNDYNNIQNWDLLRLPIAGDDVVWDYSEYDCLYNLDTPAGLAANSITVTARFENRKLGLSAINRDGTAYPEFLPRYLDMTAATVTIGGGEGAGPSLVNIDTKTTTSTITIHTTSTPPAGDQAVNLLCNDGSTKVYLTEGSLGIALEQSESATLSEIAVNFDAIGSTDATLIIGESVTLTTLVVGGGDVKSSSAITTVTQTAGDFTNYIGAITTFTQQDGTFHYRSTGTITTAVVAGTVVCDEDNRPKTVTTLNLHEGYRWVDPNGVVTITNGYVFVLCSPDDDFIVPEGITLLRTA